MFKGIVRILFAITSFIAGIIEMINGGNLALMYFTFAILMLQAHEIDELKKTR